MTTFVPTRIFFVTLAMSLALAGIASLPAPAAAQGQSAPNQPTDFGNFEVLDQLSFEGIFSIDKSINSAAAPDKKPLTTLANMLFQIGIAVLVMVSLIMTVVAGYVYMTAGGNTSQIGTAKTMIGSALLGIVLALTGWLILNTVSSRFTNPSEPSIKVPTPRPPGP